MLEPAREYTAKWYSFAGVSPDTVTLREAEELMSTTYPLPSAVPLPNVALPEYALLANSSFGAVNVLLSLATASEYVLPVPLVQSSFSEFAVLVETPTPVAALGTAAWTCTVHVAVALP